MVTINKTRREFLKIAGFSAASLALSGCKNIPLQLADKPHQPRPNILFIFSDDHACHAISAYGSRINKTPNAVADTVIIAPAKKQNITPLARL